MKRIVLAVMFALVCLSPAVAHEGDAEHVQQFEQHLDDYAADVQRMNIRLDALSEAAAEGEVPKAAVQAFVDYWEGVKYHLAVERITPEHYGPIWQAISALQTAVENGDADATQASVEQLKQALQAGMKALKAAAAA